MLSPGQDYKKVPKARLDNLSWRKWLMARCRSSRRVRQQIIDICKHDLLFFVNSFVWTYDPRKAAKSLPFITYGFQDKGMSTILDCIEHGSDLVIEKSRDMGATWQTLTVEDWLFLYHPGMTFLNVSRKEDLVDAPGDPDSLFWKLDFIHRLLPEWLCDPASIDRRRSHFGNTRTGSTIDGESTTGAAGVGGRRTAMFIDEFSRIEEGYALLAGTADTTRCRIFNFTPYGTSNASYKLARRDDIRKLRMHWSEHPEKARGLYRYNESTRRVDQLDCYYIHAEDYVFVMDGKLRSPWYDNECKRRANDREVAQMLDIDYQGSAYQFFDKALIVELQREYAMPAWWEGDISFTEEAKPRELIKGNVGPLKLWCQLDAHGRPPMRSYVAGADVSMGTGATNSCFTIADVQTGEKVLEYSTPYLRPEQFAPVCVALCRLFLDPNKEPTYFCWERQGPGVIFGKKVIELGYRHIFYQYNEQKLGHSGPADTPGWFPSPDNKRTLLQEYRAALSSRSFLNRSHEALEECLSFIHTSRGTIEHADESDTEDPTGARVNHGDRVVADALAWKLCQLRGGGSARTEEKEEVRPGSMAHRRQLVDRERQASLTRHSW